jgi:thioredoxin 1
MSIVEIKDKAQFDGLLKSHEVVILDASAEWCGPCRIISPVFEHLCNTVEYDSAKVVFAKFDTDEVPDLSQELGIRSVPVFYYFKDGELQDKLQEANPPALQKLVEQAINPN